jgi:pectinesterase
MNRTSNPLKGARSGLRFFPSPLSPPPFPSLGCAWLALLFLLPLPVFAQTYLTVAADGSARFKTVQEAIMSVPSGSPTNPVIIHLKPGTYRELIYVQREKRWFHLLGDNPTNTVIVYGLYAGMTNLDGKPIGTFKTPTALIDADDFTAEKITFENSAGPVGQALAIRVDGDRAVFRDCRFIGWQDTILVNRGRQYFDHCHVNGHVDFIFGAATSWFEQCVICSRGAGGYLTAASTPQDVPFGYVFSHCRIIGENPDTRTWLGRPWRIYASTIFLNTEMSEVVRPGGWNDWGKPETHQTARYAEFHSTGPGASPTNRVAWSRQLTAKQASAITVEKVLGGPDKWNPLKGAGRRHAAGFGGAEIQRSSSRTGHRRN